jgi:hypothetical protein
MIILRIFRLQRLRVFSDGCDSYVAFDPQDAVEAWKELTCEEGRDEYADPFNQVPDSKILTIGCECCEDFDDLKRRRPLFSKLHPDEDFPSISAPAWAWALQNGRGFLSSKEW